MKLDAVVLITDKLEKMRAFYTGVLGQAVKMDFGNCIALECGVSLWRLTEEYPIAKATGATYFDTANKNMEVCFETEDFIRETAVVKQSGAKLLHDVQTETWGQQTIRFYDPDENLVELGESIPCFCKRIAGSGKSAAQVSEITGIPISGVKAILGE